MADMNQDDRLADDDEPALADDDTGENAGKCD